MDPTSAFGLPVSWAATGTDVIQPDRHALLYTEAFLIWEGSRHNAFVSDTCPLHNIFSLRANPAARQTTIEDLSTM